MSDAVSLPSSDHESSLGRRSRLRVLLWLGAALLLLLSIIPISWAVIRWRTNQAIAAEMDRIRAAGEPASFEDVIDSIPPLAPEQDCTQMYDEVFAIITSQVWERRAGSLPYIGDGETDESSIPPPGVAWPGLEAAANFIDGESYNLMTLDKAAALGGECRFALTGSELKTQDVMRFGHKPRAAARLLSLRSILAAHRNDPGELHQTLTTLGVLPNCLAAEPQALSIEVRVALYGMYYYQSVQMLDFAGFSDEQLAALQDVTRGVDYCEQLRHAIRWERLYCAQCFDGTYALDGELTALMSKRPRSWFYVSHVDAWEYWRAMRRYCDATRSNDVVAVWRDTNQVNDDIQQTLARTSVMPQRYFVTHGTVGGAWHLAAAAVRGTATDRAFNTFVACYRYKLKHGAFPERLDDLVPACLAAVPQDPYANAPIRMTEINGDLVIYSVGPDGKDDGGEARSDDLRYRSSAWKRTYEESRAAAQGTATSAEDFAAPAEQENTSP